MGEITNSSETKPVETQQVSSNESSRPAVPTKTGLPNIARIQFDEERASAGAFDDIADKATRRPTELHRLDKVENVVLPPLDCHAILRTLILKWLGKSETDESKAYGAEAIRQADRFGGGVEPVPDRLHERISIADLESSPLYRYRFTLK